MYHLQDDIFDELEREMQRLSDEALLHMFRLPGMTHNGWAPRVDVYETESSVVVRACAAGIKPKDTEISLSADNRHLTIRGIRAEHCGEKTVKRRYYQLEIYFGPFERVVHLPADIPIDRDKLRATYKDGFLHIELPKLAQNDTVSRTIPITE